MAEAVARVGGPTIEAAVYDGDTPPAVKRRMRHQPPPVLITNPDMLHLGLLGYHDKWADFFHRLKFVVLDEAHIYRGIFGSHIVQVIRRLERICQYYGSNPNYLLSTATIDNPAVFGQTLIGRPVEAVTETGAPRSGRYFMMVNPDLSAAHTAARLFIRAIKAGLKTIVFTRARKTTELIHMWTKSAAPKNRISSYRAGFLPEERRRIEADLAADRLDGVISTSALELGIDIGSLDLCILVGYPGTVVTTWQRAGRVGRTDRESGVIMVAQPDALDQYFISYPREFFDRGYEPAIVDPDNEEVMGPHLVCAASETPLAADDSTFGLAGKDSLIKKLIQEKKLLADQTRSFYHCIKTRPHLGVNIRSIGESFTIFRAGAKEAIGTVDGIRAYKECHQGAVYLHLGRQYLVEEFDLERRNIIVSPVKADYYTRVKAEKETEILETLAARPTPNFVVRLGRLKVTEQVMAYEKRRIRGQELLSTHPLELPPTTFETVGLWVEIEEDLRRMLIEAKTHFMGGIHAMEHAAIAVFPLLALCDRNDIGGIAYPDHPQLGKSAVFIYDGHPGGVGLAKSGFEMIEELLAKALNLVTACECEEGCPSCIHSPKCGAGNKPLDKTGCRLVLEALLGRRDWHQPTPVAEEPVEIEEAAPSPDKPVYGVLDIETQRLAAEVGGWGNSHLMGVSCAVLYDSEVDDYLVYTEADLPRLFDRLQKLPLVIGFNIIRFDYKVLSAYTDLDFKTIPTLDLLAELEREFDFRVSLDKLAQATLGKAKSADGLKAVEWFRNGELDKVIDYCKIDVQVTKELFEHGVEEGFVIAPSRNKAPVRLDVSWADRVRELTA